MHFTKIFVTRIKYFFEIYSLINYNAVGYGSSEILSPSKTEPVGTGGADLDAGVGALPSGARGPAPRGRCGSAGRRSPADSPARARQASACVRTCEGSDCSSQKESERCTCTHVGDRLSESAGGSSSPMGHRLGLEPGAGEASHSLAFCGEACCPFSRRPNWTRGAVTTCATAEGNGPTGH